MVVSAYSPALFASRQHGNTGHEREGRYAPVLHQSRHIGRNVFSQPALRSLWPRRRKCELAGQRWDEQVSRLPTRAHQDSVEVVRQLQRDLMEPMRRHNRIIRRVEIEQKVLIAGAAILFAVVVSVTWVARSTEARSECELESFSNAEKSGYILAQERHNRRLSHINESAPSA